MTWWNSIPRVVAKHRRRLALAVLLLGSWVVGREVLGAYPREVALQYRLGPSHASVVAMTLSYRSHGDELSGVRFSWPTGAPSVVEHEVDLAPGHYEVSAELVHRDGQRRVERRFDVPVDGVVQVDLFSVGFARRSGPGMPPG